MAVELIKATVGTAQELAHNQSVTTEISFSGRKAHTHNCPLLRETPEALLHIALDVVLHGRQSVYHARIMENLGDCQVCLEAYRTAWSEERNRAQQRAVQLRQVFREDELLTKAPIVLTESIVIYIRDRMKFRREMAELFVTSWAGMLEEARLDAEEVRGLPLQQEVQRGSNTVPVRESDHLQLSERLTPLHWDIDEALEYVASETTLADSVIYSGLEALTAYVKSFDSEQGVYFESTGWIVPDPKRGFLLIAEEDKVPAVEQVKSVDQIRRSEVTMSNQDRAKVSFATAGEVQSGGDTPSAEEPRSEPNVSGELLEFLGSLHQSRKEQA